MTNISAREAAFYTLVKCEKNGSYSNIEENIGIKRYSLKDSERALYTALIKGVIERKITLDYHISKISDREISGLDINLLTVLRLGAYQIFYFDRIPTFAVVNESVNLAKKQIGRGTHSFVNAVLRELIRKKEQGRFEIPIDGIERLSVEYSIPTDLISMWQEQYGEENTLNILASLSHPHGMTLHTNTLKISRDALVSRLCEIGVEAKASNECASAVRLPLGTTFESIELFANDGLFFVQDIASQTAVKMLGAKEDDIVIDTCACPGGKSFALALEMNNKGKIYSFDLHKNKFSLLHNSASKLGIEIIETRELDARKPDETLFGKADCVLCDVPCSGFGIISKKPEIRYRDIKSLDRFSSLALEILNASKHYTKNGGKLLFSTCTLNKRENDETLIKFLSENSEFELISSETIFPSDDNDGFFAALMIKREG